MKKKDRQFPVEGNGYFSSLDVVNIHVAVNPPEKKPCSSCLHITADVNLCGAVR